MLSRNIFNKIISNLSFQSANVSEVISIEHIFLSKDDKEEIILCSFKKQILVYKKKVEHPEWGELFSWMPGDEASVILCNYIYKF